VDLEMVKLLSKVYAFYEEEGHVIMDCPFVPFHIRTVIVGHEEFVMPVCTASYMMAGYGHAHHVF
jgi:hypothetical protein